MHKGKPIATTRRELVAQLRAAGIRDERVLAAMAKVRREVFVRPDLRQSAYADCALPIGEGQTISQPYIVALMTEALAPREGHRVLEVGTGSGYQTAILAELCGQVLSVERSQQLGERSGLRLHALGYLNVTIHIGDGSVGWADGAPYDGILVTAGSPAIPDELVAQLAEGGRLVIPVGTLDRQSLQLVIKQQAGQESPKITPKNERQTAGSREGLAVIDLGACRFVPLLGQAGWKDTR